MGMALPHQLVPGGTSGGRASCRENPPRNRALTPLGPALLSTRRTGPAPQAVHSGAAMAKIRHLVPQIKAEVPIAQAAPRHASCCAGRSSTAGQLAWRAQISFCCIWPVREAFEACHGAGRCKHRRDGHHAVPAGRGTFERPVVVRPGMASYAAVDMSDRATAATRTRSVDDMPAQPCQCLAFMSGVRAADVQQTTGRAETVDRDHVQGGLPPQRPRPLFQRPPWPTGRGRTSRYQYAPIVAARGRPGRP